MNILIQPCLDWTFLTFLADYFLKCYLNCGKHINFIWILSGINTIMYVTFFLDKLCQYYLLYRGIEHGIHRVVDPIKPYFRTGVSNHVDTKNIDLANVLIFE